MSAEWTETHGPCFFCFKTEEGYARKDEKGAYQPACFACAKKPYAQPPQFVHNVNKEQT